MHLPDVHDRIATGAVRDDFPILSRMVDAMPLVYLDNAATALKPQPVIDAVTGYYTKCTANVHRGRHRLSEEASDQFEEARYKVALFAGCASNEVIFVKNTTEALNLAAHCIALSENDLVVGCLDSHHSQILPWLTRANYVAVRQGDDWQPDLEHFAALMQRRPKCVVLTHCSNVTGNYLPLEQMAAMARAAGALVVVDAAQSAAHAKLNFHELGIDFLAISSHKLMGPSGIGCLIGKADLLRDAAPMLVGGGVVDYLTLDRIEYRKIPHKFEAGTPAIEAAIGFAAAIDYIQNLGFDAVARQEHLLSATFLEEVGKYPRLRFLGPECAERRAPIFSIHIDGIGDLSDVCRALSDSHGVMCRNGHLCAQPLVDHYTSGQVLRMSAYIYNTPSEIAFALSALDRVVHAYTR